MEGLLQHLHRLGQIIRVKLTCNLDSILEVLISQIISDDTWSSHKGSAYRAPGFSDVYSNTNKDLYSERSSFSGRGSYRSNDEGSLEDIKKKILGRGLRGLLGILKSLRLLDQDKLQNLPVNAFVKALNDYRLGIDEMVIKQILEDEKLILNGRVEYETFLSLVIGKMSQFRKKLVEGTYGRISTDKKGYVTVDDIKGKKIHDLSITDLEIFDPRHHPDVRSQKREEEDIALEHVDTVELHHMLFVN